MKLPKTLISKLPDKDMQNAPFALLRAAKYARKLAQETGTPLVYRNAGKLIQEIPRTRLRSQQRTRTRTRSK
jgi:hypothetical protein